MENANCRTKIARVAVLLWVGAALTACKLDFSVPPQGVGELTVYQSEKQIFKVVLRGDDPVITTVNDWIASHSDGWSYAYITRPSRIYLVGSGYKVNIQEHEVSVKYCRGTFNCHFFVKDNEDLFPLVKNSAILRDLPIQK